MSDPFGEENVEITEEFVEGDINENDLIDGNVEYVDGNGISFETTTFDNSNNNNNNNHNNNNYNSGFDGDLSSVDGDMKPKETAPAMREYLEKHEKEMQEKKKKSEEKRQKKIAEAKQSLDNFYSEREAKKKTALKNNRDHNKSLEIDSTSGNTTHTWESVVSMIDLQAKPNPANKDTSRMREILIRLKNQPIV
ncbi:hypothetical protein ACTFIY_004383 [Dictyostelium cf. discoideum]